MQYPSLLLACALFLWGFHSFLGSHMYDVAFVQVGTFFSTLLPRGYSSKPIQNQDGFDYNDIESAWSAHPGKRDWADNVPPLENPEEVSSTKVGVFYVYPSGYFGFQWNSPFRPSLLQDPLGVLGDVIADATGMVHASVFNFGQVYTPRYRQMTAWGFLSADEKSKEQAMELALLDVQRALDHFLAVNPNRPIILAGHSQGSMLLCRLLREKKSSLPSLVAAYLIAADLTDDACGVPVCRDPFQLNCFVHYNALLREGGDRSKFLLDPNQGRNLTCVNPLSFTQTRHVVSAWENPGSRPFMRPITVLTSLATNLFHTFTFSSTPATNINFMSALEPGLFGAQCKDGVVWVDYGEFGESATGFWTTGVFPGLNLHGGESSLFYASTRQNAKQRVNRFYDKLLLNAS